MRYVGAPVSVSADVTYQSYVESVKDADLDTATIDAQIDAALASYATTSYVDTQDALLVPTTYVDAQDNLRIKTASKGIANGVAALDATGRISPNNINVASTQKYFRGPWTPATYNAAALTGVTAEADLYSVPVTDPGYSYKLVVFGIAEGRSDLAGQWPQINVRVGSTAGTIIAQGVGDAATVDVPTGLTVVDNFERVSNTGLGSGWSTAYTFGDSGSGAKIDTADGHNAMLDWTPFFANAVQRHKWAGTGALTGVDNQSIEITVGDTNFGSNASVEIIGRITSDWSNWVRCNLGNSSCAFYWRVNGTEYGPVAGIGAPGFPCSLGDKLKFNIGSTGNPQLCVLQKNGVTVASGDLSSFAASAGQPAPVFGSSHRGWGFGMTVLATGQLPFKVDNIQLTDGLTSPNLNTIRIVPLGLDTQTPRTGATTLYVRLLRSGGASTVQATAYSPRIFVMAVPA